MKNALLMLLASIAWGVFGQAQSGHIEVIVLLYSGRQNPTFDIKDPQDIANLKGLTRDLPPAEEPRWRTLPPCGFQLANHGISQFPQELRVCAGVIRKFQGGELEYFKDARGMEQWLVTQARKRGINPDRVK